MKKKHYKTGYNVPGYLLVNEIATWIISKDDKHLFVLSRFIRESEDIGEKE